LGRGIYLPVVTVIRLKKEKTSFFVVDICKLHDNKSAVHFY
jgi:hypothetical protein